MNFVFRTLPATIDKLDESVHGRTIWGGGYGPYGHPPRLFRKVMKSHNLRFWLQFSAKYMGILGSLIFSIIVLYEYRVNLIFLRNRLT